MRNKKFLSLLFFFIAFNSIGCAKPQRTIDPELLPYVLAFEKYYNVYYNGDVLYQPIPMKNKYITQVGVCVYNKVTKNSYIIINKDYPFNSETMEAIILHEMGHCVLNVGHNDSIGEGGCALSIMHPQFPASIKCWNEYKEYYYDELKTQSLLTL